MHKPRKSSDSVPKSIVPKSSAVKEKKGSLFTRERDTSLPILIRNLKGTLWMIFLSSIPSLSLTNRSSFGCREIVLGMVPPAERLAIGKLDLSTMISMPAWGPSFLKF
ncbi:hypothetical protein HanPI659440_Chr03g0127531 [Helianthus annuus]|nr:hypothetical protein HanPI659440_Chr03g0127531 [Helianthus annuus]